MRLSLHPVFAQAFCEWPSTLVQALMCATLLICLSYIANFVADVLSIARSRGNRNSFIVRFLCLAVGLGFWALVIISLHGIATL